MPLPNDPHTGCGIYPIILKDTKFYAACEFHDKAYLEQSWHQQNKSRKEIDDWFYQQMKFLAGNNVLDRLRAKVFYSIARVFGGLWWEGEK